MDVSGEGRAPRAQVRGAAIPGRRPAPRGTHPARGRPWSPAARSSRRRPARSHARPPRPRSASSPSGPGTARAAGAQQSRAGPGPGRWPGLRRDAREWGSGGRGEDPGGAGSRLTRHGHQSSSGCPQPLLCGWSRRRTWPQAGPPPIVPAPRRRGSLSTQPVGRDASTWWLDCLRPYRWGQRRWALSCRCPRCELRAQPRPVPARGPPLGPYSPSPPGLRV